MPVFRGSSVPVFTFTRPGQDPAIPTPHLKVHGYASPSRGSKEMCVWRLTLAPGIPPRVGMADHEEFFMVISGAATVILDGEQLDLNAGDAILFPANTTAGLGNLHSEPVEMVEVCPVGMRVSFGDMEPFVPDWAK